jgi:hypothetical protein
MTLHAPFTMQAYIESDAIKPCPELRFVAKRTNGGECLSKSFLRGIFGIVARMEQRKRQVEYSLTITVQQNLKGFARTFLTTHDEYTVTFLTRRSTSYMTKSQAITEYVVESRIGVHLVAPSLV